MNRPSLRQLEYAVALADAGHFGKAARACAVTQPALSAQIRGLEDLLGLRLFERSRRGARPTRAGEAVIARARLALRALDDLTETARQQRDPLAGPVHLGVIPTLAPYLLPLWLPAVREVLPSLRLYLHEDQTDRIVAALRRGELDLLLLALPVEGRDLVFQPLFDEPFVLVVPAGHRLAGHSGPVAEEALADEEVLLLEDGHCLREQALAVCQLAGARENAIVRANSLNTLVQMVAGGLGVTLVPESAVPVEIRRNEDVRVRRFRFPEPSRSIGLVWRRSTARGTAFRRLGDLLPVFGRRADRPEGAAPD